MPRLGWPNRLTLLRLLLAVPVAWLLIDNVAEPARWKRLTAVALFLSAAVTDMLDGWLARKLQEFTRLGRLLDPLADKGLVLCGLVVLSLYPVGEGNGPHWKLPLWVAAAAVGRDLTVGVGFLALMATAGKARIEPRPLGKWCTFAQMAAIPLMLIAPELPAGLARLATWPGYLAGALAAAAAADYIYLGVRRAREARIHA